MLYTKEKFIKKNKSRVGKRITKNNKRIQPWIGYPIQIQIQSQGKSLSFLFKKPNDSVEDSRRFKLVRCCSFSLF